MKKAFSLILALTLIFSLSVPAAAAETASGTTLRLEETEGAVTVTTSGGQEKSVVKGMRLYNGYVVSTGASSSAYVSLDDAKVVKLGANGKAELTKSGKKLEVSLLAGQLFFNVTQPLKTDESLNIRTATMVTGIRGTFGWQTPTAIALLDGHAEVRVASGAAADAATKAVVAIAAGETVSAAPTADGTAATLEQPTAIAAEDIPAMVVQEIASDPALAERVTEALAETTSELNVESLVESLPEKQAAEAAAEQEAQQQAEQAVQEQEQTIAANDAADEAAGVETTVDYAAEKAGTAAESAGADNTAASTGSNVSSGSGGDKDSSSRSSSVTLTTLPEGQTEASAALNAALAQNTAVTLDITGEVFLGRVTVPAGRTLTLRGRPNTTGDSSNSLNSLYCHIGDLVNSGTLVIEAGAYLATGGTSRNDGRITASGALTVQEGAFTNNGTITVPQDLIVVEGTKLTNNGTITVSGWYMNYGETVNNKTITIQNSGRLYNEGRFTVERGGSLVVNGYFEADEHVSNPIINNGGTVSGNIAEGQVVNQGDTLTITLPSALTDGTVATDYTIQVKTENGVEFVDGDTSVNMTYKAALDTPVTLTLSPVTGRSFGPDTYVGDAAFGVKPDGVLNADGTYTVTFKLARSVNLADLSVGYVYTVATLGSDINNLFSVKDDNGEPVNDRVMVSGTVEWDGSGDGVPENCQLCVPFGATLTIPRDVGENVNGELYIAAGGKVLVSGELTNNGTIENYGAITLNESEEATYSRGALNNLGGLNNYKSAAITINGELRNGATLTDEGKLRSATLWNTGSITIGESGCLCNYYYLYDSAGEPMVGEIVNDGTIIGAGTLENGTIINDKSYLGTISGSGTIAETVKLVDPSSSGSSGYSVTFRLDSDPYAFVIKVDGKDDEYYDYALCDSMGAVLSDGLALLSGFERKDWIIKGTGTATQLRLYQHVDSDWLTGDPLYTCEINIKTVEEAEWTAVPKTPSVKVGWDEENNRYTYTFTGLDFDHCSYRIKNEDGGVGYYLNAQYPLSSETELAGSYTLYAVQVTQEQGTGQYTITQYAPIVFVIPEYAPTNP